MTPAPDVLAALREQQAPASHLQRLADLVALAGREPSLRAIFLVGSYARGTGDRVSDLDLVAIADHGRAAEVLAAAQEILARHEVLDAFTGSHPAGGAFWKGVYLDFSSVEFHVFEPGTTFRLKRPYLALWDPDHLLSAYAVDGEPIRHADFAAYEYGDDGLIWELVDCIKWASRGQHALARHHLAKMVAAFRPGTPAPPAHDPRPVSHDLPALPAIPPGRYRHYKGGEYEVLGVVRHTESLEPLVLYRPLSGDSGTWVRPFAMFIETVVHDGRVQPRFSRVGEVAATAQDESADGLRAEPLTSADDADWLSMRLALWPDCPRDEHLEEMAGFLREPARYAQFIVREPAGRGIGFAEASLRTDYVNSTSSSPVAYLEGLYVAPEARRRGVARRLVGAVAAWARAAGCRELASDTQPENEVSQAVHARLGFVETERAVFFSLDLDAGAAG